MIHNPEDKLLKSICSSHLNIVLKTLGLHYNPIATLPTEIQDSQHKTKIMDFVFKTDKNIIINLEFQSSKLNKKDLNRFLLYYSTLGYKYKKNIVLIYIICSFNTQNIKTEIPNMPNIKFNPNILSFKDLDGDEKLNNIENKIKNKQKIKKEQIIELSLIPLMNTKNTTKEQIKKIIQIIPKLKIKNKETEETIIDYLSYSISKFIKTKTEKNKLWEELIMPAEFVKEYNEEQKRNAWKEGLEEGIEKGIFNVAKALVKENVPLKTIMKTTNLNKEDIESLK